MTEHRLIAALTAGAIATSMLPSAFAADPPPKVGPPPPAVFGTVNAKGVVTLKNKAGKKLTKLKRGRYTLTVQDLSKSEVFRIVGPGLNKATGKTFTGATIWGVNLKVGTYTIRSLSKKSVKTIVITKK